MFSLTSEDDLGERERWNHKYRGAPTAWSSTPDPFLERAFSEYVLPLYPEGGSALDFAGGAGRHAIWLAKQGWEVTLMDISEAGIELARRNAGPLASRIHLVADDLTRFKASQTHVEHSHVDHSHVTRGFDVVMVFFYLERTIFSELLRAIRPGGLLLYKTYTSVQGKLPDGPKNPAHLLEPGELLRLAAGLRVLYYREEMAERAPAELVAQKVAAGTDSPLDL
jgi:tellurite methyltransferase